jgi:hypothetical protein
MMKAVAQTLGVSRSNLHERHSRVGAIIKLKTRRSCHASSIWWRSALTYGYRRITAVLNRELRAEGLAPANHNRVHWIMKKNSLLLERSGFDRPERTHDGKVIMMRSNLRWCSDGWSSHAGMVSDVRQFHAKQWQARGLSMVSQLTLMLQIFVTCGLCPIRHTSWFLDTFKEYHRYLSPCTS